MKDLQSPLKGPLRGAQIHFDPHRSARRRCSNALWELCAALCSLLLCASKREVLIGRVAACTRLCIQAGELALLWREAHTAAPPGDCVHVCVCVRNLSSAGEEARSQLRCCDGLVDSLLHVLRVCVNTSDYDSKVRT